MPPSPHCWSHLSTSGCECSSFVSVTCPPPLLQNYSRFRLGLSLGFPLTLLFLLESPLWFTPVVASGPPGAARSRRGSWSYRGCSSLCSSPVGCCRGCRRGRCLEELRLERKALRRRIGPHHQCEGSGWSDECCVVISIVVGWSVDCSWCWDS